MRISRRHILGAAAGTAAGLAALPLRAQGKYPSRPIQIIIPTAAGGGMDIFARLFGQHLTDHYGQPTVVVSKPGANTAIASAYVAGAEPDGHTLLLTYSAVQINTITMPNPGYRWKDLAPIVSTVLSPVGLAVHSSVPARNMQEFIAYVKSGANKAVSYGSYGVGSVAHFMGESLNAAAGLDMRHVPYKGSTPAMMDLIGGQIVAAFGDVGQFSREEQSSGRIRVLGVNGEARLPLLPSIPTFREQGLTQLDLPAWHGLFAPAATPKAIVDDLAREMVRIIRAPQVSTRIRELGFEPSGLTGDAFTQYVDGAGKVLENLFKSGRVKIE